MNETKDDLKREKVRIVPISNIEDFPDHPFQVKDDESMDALVESIPLLYCLNRDWYDALMNTVFGKIVLAISGVVIIITAIRMNKITKPIEYKR